MGLAELPLHGGRAPRWLFRRMVRLARPIVTLVVEEYGTAELLRRLADPFWFQALSLVLGYDWHSSGTTTVTTAVLREVLADGELGVMVAGGKGRASRRAPEEIRVRGELLGLSNSKIEELIRSSRLSAKVDNAALQDGFSLYHHAIFFDSSGRWTVVQQGMMPERRLARRYHWYGPSVGSFVREPHFGIASDAPPGRALNMVALESEGARRASVDAAREGPWILSSAPREQRLLSEYFGERVLRMPWKVNWDALRRLYEFQPRNYEELLGIRGVGPATVRALAYIAEVVYGEEPSWRDPVKFSFALGGKDGVPRPINLKTYEETITFMEELVSDALGKEVKERFRNLFKKINIYYTIKNNSF